MGIMGTDVATTGAYNLLEATKTQKKDEKVKYCKNLTVSGAFNSTKVGSMSKPKALEGVTNAAKNQGTKTKQLDYTKIVPKVNCTTSIYGKSRSIGDTTLTFPTGPPAK